MGNKKKKNRSKQSAAPGNSAPARPASGDDGMHAEIQRMLRNGPVVVNLPPGVSYPVGPGTRFPPGAQFLPQTVMVNAGGASSSSGHPPFGRIEPFPGGRYSKAFPFQARGSAPAPVPADLAGKPEPEKKQSNSKAPSSSNPPPPVNECSTGKSYYEVDSDPDSDEGYFTG